MWLVLGQAEFEAMTKKPFEIELSPDAVTTTSTFSNPGYAEHFESVPDRVKKWFIEPLKRMKDSEGFLVLLVLFPLYEKHLRTLREMKGDKFSEGNPIFCVIGEHLGISKDDAYQFWQNIRNGLLHRANPKTPAGFDYGIRSVGPSIEKDGNRFWINPFQLRDDLLKVIEPSVHSWEMDDTPLAKTFVRIGL